MFYEIYGFLHKMAKKIIYGVQENTYRMISITGPSIQEGMIQGEGTCFNEMSPARKIEKCKAYPVENIVPYGQFQQFPDSFTKACGAQKYDLGTDDMHDLALWESFINSSIIPEGFRNEGLHYAGFIYEMNEWCLPSWIWTNAALVRMYCRCGDIQKAKALANRLMDKQLPCGGWIVRNDYDASGAIPVMAPNDSAYIANNALLEVFLISAERQYLEAAEKCAEWIILTARKDGLVYVGYDVRRQEWKKNNIVDIGFTAALFARLYEITQVQKYLNFLRKFVKRYIELFYMPSKKSFSTALDYTDNQLGGAFTRGQAWALEGLIPAYKVLKSEQLKSVIDSTIQTLIRKQHRNGGWPYNLQRPLMGQDCKAVSIVACSILAWHKLFPERMEYASSARKALEWCRSHTATGGRAMGGIFSYSIEGAIVHHLYTHTAFVYSCAYAIELKQILDEAKNGL